jgi:hypothetical protein
MNLVGVPAYSVQLAELLAEVLKQGGHLQAPPKDHYELIKVAKGVIAAGPRTEQTPVFVVEMEDGSILSTSGTQAAHIIFIDTDTEDSDDEDVVHVLGQDHQVTQFQVEASPASAILVDQVLTAVTAAAEAAEAARPLPRYVVGPHWKNFLSDMEDEQCMRFVCDTQAKQILAMHLETESGYVLASSSMIAEVHQVLMKSDDAFANPYSYGIEYVDHVPEWAQPFISLKEPEPVFISLPNYTGPTLYSATHLQDHAVAYVLTDRLAAGREYEQPPSIDYLPALPVPDFPGLPEHGVDGHFSKAQLFAYRELAAEAERDDYAHALMDAAEEEETEAPRA